MDIDIVTAVDDDLVEAFRQLIPQLSSSAAPVTADDLRAVAEHPACALLVARDGGRVVGTTTLVVFPIPTGVRAWIEDVVVDEAVRGRGVGAALTRAALDRARDQGATTVDLTSRPSRAAANALYQGLGFTQRETNVYRYRLT